METTPITVAQRVELIADDLMQDLYRGLRGTVRHVGKMGECVVEIDGPGAYAKLHQSTLRQINDVN